MRLIIITTAKAMIVGVCQFGRADVFTDVEKCVTRVLNRHMGDAFVVRWRQFLSRKCVNFWSICNSVGDAAAGNLGMYGFGSGPEKIVVPFRIGNS
jgi:hypothetical protein